MSKVLVVAEISGGKVKKTTLSAIGFARTVAGATGGSFDILAPGAGAGAGATELAGYGAGSVLVADDPYLKGYVGERFAPTIIAAAQGYDVVVMTASAF